MPNTTNEVAYKEQLIRLLLFPLEIAGIENQDSKNFDEDYRKRLKFQFITDWKRYRACVDLIEDTECAIDNFFQYQLGDLSRENRSLGEKYLRLYGILNAVYLQMSGFVELMKLINYPYHKDISRLFEQSDIYKLRNIAGAHTVDYAFDKDFDKLKSTGRKKTSFRIMQSDLEETGSKITTIDENGVKLQFNMLDILGNYERNSTDIIVKLVRYLLGTLIIRKEDKNKVEDRVKILLNNLLDYSTIDKNRDYFEKQFKEIKRKYSI